MMREYAGRQAGGVLRGIEPIGGSYDLSTPHMGFAVKEHGEPGDMGNRRYAEVFSPMLGNHIITPYSSMAGWSGYGEFVLNALATPLSMRADDISQLTKLRDSSTIPNAQDFFRKQTLELLELHRIMLEANPRFMRAAGLSELDLRQQAENILIEDWMHYATSHGLEVLLKGWGSDQTGSTTGGNIIIPAGMPGLDIVSLDASGQLRIDKNFDFISAEKRLVDIPGIDEEVGIPGVDLDKFHYTMTEIALWFSDYPDEALQEMIERASSHEAIALTDQGEVYFKDPEVALFFAKCYLLLSTEHWNDYMQRLQVFASNQQFSMAVVERHLDTMYDEKGELVDHGVTQNPVSYAYGIDTDISNAIIASVNSGNEYANVLREMHRTNGMQERSRFIANKRSVYAAFLLDRYATDYPNATPLNNKRGDYSQKFGPPSPMYEITRATHEECGKEGVMPRFDDDSASFTLSSLKYRSVNPLVRMPDGRIIPLSEAGLAYDNLLRQHYEAHQVPVKVQMHISPDYYRILKVGYNRTTEQFEALRRQEVLGRDDMARLLRGAAARARVISESRGTLRAAA